MTEILARMQLRHGTLAAWTSANPILLAAEPGYETDTNVMRVGDGVTQFLSLEPIFLGLKATSNLDDLANVVTARLNLGLPLQSTPMDGALGKVLAIGAGDVGPFGIGSGIAPLLSDINDETTKSGMYRITTATTGTFPPGSLLQTVIVMAYNNPTNMMQIASDLATPNRMSFRSRSSGVWRPWLSIVTSANVASIAQSQEGLENTLYMTPLRTKQALNASGGAPTFACRAWVNFNGFGTPSIRASGNVSSITRHGVGNYTINFTTPMQDANYCLTGSAASVPNHALIGVSNDISVPRAVGSVRISVGTSGGIDVVGFAADSALINVAIFR